MIPTWVTALCLFGCVVLSARIWLTSRARQLERRVVRNLRRQGLL